MTNKKRERIDVRELIRRLESDPEYQKKIAEMERKDPRYYAALREEDAQVCAALREVGVEVDSVYDLLEWKKNPDVAIPVLLEWLTRCKVRRIKEGVIRALGGPRAGKEVVRALIAVLDDCVAKKEPELCWVLGNAISIAAEPRDFDELLRLVRDPRYGDARQMLAMALGRKGAKNKEVAMETLVALLDDPVVQGHALTGLRYLRMEASRAAIEPLLSHEKAWIRKGARGALAALDKARSSSKR